MKPENSVQRLVGDQLSHVCFVMDYLQLGFSGTLLNCYTAVRIQTATGTIFSIPDDGSRDALCSFIGCEITAIQIIENNCLRLFFVIGSIEVPLDEVSRKFGDAAELISPNCEPMIVF